MPTSYAHYCSTSLIIPLQELIVSWLKEVSSFMITVYSFCRCLGPNTWNACNINNNVYLYRLCMQRCAPASIRLMDSMQFQMGKKSSRASTCTFISSLLYLCWYVGQILKPAPSLLKSFIDGLKRIYVTKVSPLWSSIEKIGEHGDKASTCSVQCSLQDFAIEGYILECTEYLCHCPSAHARGLL